MNELQALKQEILRLTRQFSRQAHALNRPADDPLRPSWQSDDPIPYAGRIFTEEEVVVGVSSMLDFWLTLGTEGASFQTELSQFFGIRSSILVNSGSSANLVAISALTSHLIPKARRLEAGTEVITVAAGFPTTVAPIIQVGAIPVFLDVDPITANARCEQLENAYKPGKTKAVMMAHALGNPFNIAKILSFCRRYNLWLIEDNCDALGSSYSMPRDLALSLGITENSPGLDDGPDRIVRWTGTWGDLSTQSFYPPHHITMGEGGCVNVIRDPLLKTIVESFRDWGRDCWCPSGVDNTCKKRFDWQLGDLPPGYDHKYIYSHLGYNLKPLDPQAAIGRIQLKRLPGFILARKQNWHILRSGLAHHENVLDFALPTHAVSWNLDHGFKWDDSGCRSDCSWFGFMIRVNKEAQFLRTEMARYLDLHKIGNRMFFGGNLLRQPAFANLQKEHCNNVVVPASLDGADSIMNHALFVGTYPGLTSHQLEKIIISIDQFISSNRIM